MEGDRDPLVEGLTAETLETAPALHGPLFTILPADLTSRPLEPFRGQDVTDPLWVKHKARPIESQSDGRSRTAGGARPTGAKDSQVVEGLGFLGAQQIHVAQQILGPTGPTVMTDPTARR